MPTIWLAPPKIEALMNTASKVLKPFFTASAPNSIANGSDETTTGTLSLAPCRNS